MKYTYLFAKKMSGRQGKEFTIDCNGYFKSAGTAERVTVEVCGDYLEKEYPGDVLVSVYCSVGSIVVEIGDVIYAGQSSYNFFRTSVSSGLPLTGQYTGPIRITANASQERIYAVYEKYDTLDRELLASYRAPYDVSYGVKLRDGEHTYQVKDGNLETY
jgi:hypothetical protein